MLIVFVRDSSIILYVNEAKLLLLTSYQRGANGQRKQVDTLLYEGKVLGFLFYSIEGGA